MAAEYRPWRILRDQPDIEVVRVPLPVGLEGVLAEDDDGNAVLLLGSHLLRADRDATIWHELTHRSRGGSGWRPGLPPNLLALVAKEELACDRIVAATMLPDERLEPLRRRPDPVTFEEAAEELEVPASVLRRRLAG